MWRLLKQAYLEVVTRHTGRDWRAMSEEEKADALTPWHANMERDVRALAECARHAYSVGVGTVHNAMTQIDADPFAVDDAVLRAMENEQTKKDDRR